MPGKLEQGQRYPGLAAYREEGTIESIHKMFNRGSTVFIPKWNKIVDIMVCML